MRINQRQLQQMVAGLPRTYEKKEGPDIETEIKAMKAEILAGLASSGEKVEEKQRRMQTQLDALDAKIATVHHSDPGNGGSHKSIGQQVVEAQAYLEQKSQEFRGKAPIRILLGGAFERKATITDTSLGQGTSGVLMPMRIPGITGLAQQGFRLRDLMRVRPMTEGNSFDYVRQNLRTNAASPQIEAAAKAESTYGWTSVSDRVRTLAHFTNVSRQGLDDSIWLRKQIDSELMYGLQLVEEREILAGNGTGEHLNGLLTQATAYNTGFNIAGDTKIDVLRHSKLQARLAGLETFAPSAFVLHPTDMEKIELIKVDQSGANTGLYILGDPRTGTQLKFIWGLPVVESDSITAGTFLVGAFDTAAELVDRMSATVDISYEHASNWTSNLATILCEERIGLAIFRPDAFVTGSY